MCRSRDGLSLNVSHCISRFPTLTTLQEKTMASLYQRAGSPYWWIGIKDSSGKWKYGSTKLRHDNPQETKIAKARAAATAVEEERQRPLNHSERWDSWVGAYLDAHCTNLVTRQGYEQSWLWLRSYLMEIGVSVPSELTYQHCVQFVKWRCENGAKAKIKRNTAIRDLKVLRILMQHAVRSSMSPGNPALSLRIKKEQAKEKPEFTDDQIAAVFAKLKENDWRHVAFKIALETGCRLSETQIDFEDVDFKRKTIRFVDPKGGKAYSTILPPSLEPLLKKIKAKKARFTVELPTNASQKFSNLLQDVGLSTHCFHSARVTFINRLHRAGVSEKVARQAVNHSSEAVHRVYRRESVDDLAPLRELVLYQKTKRA